MNYYIIFFILSIVIILFFDIVKNTVAEIFFRKEDDRIFWNSKEDFRKINELKKKQLDEFDDEIQNQTTTSTIFSQEQLQILNNELNKCITTNDDDI
jgi:hypothetical protein